MRGAEKINVFIKDEDGAREYKFDV
jgi:hypothetical protein